MPGRNEKLGHGTMRHFSQSNPKGPMESDVPSLLRRVAQTIEDLGHVEVYDITFQPGLTEDAADWYSMTVYYDYPESLDEGDAG